MLLSAFFFKFQHSRGQPLNNLMSTCTASPGAVKVVVKLSNGRTASAGLILRLLSNTKERSGDPGAAGFTAVKVPLWGLVVLQMPPLPRKDMEYVHPGVVATVCSTPPLFAPSQYAIR